ncbi:hypothetical protein LVJ94_45985 [Pendulispora rubella]|uniref:Glycosyltransferase RgtA/B/C/D-like domain-containing protein n=1 Tax=Pendulispora rubella TaxID=2741070 RepID=A0ABZ2L6F3_9BACT
MFGLRITLLVFLSLLALVAAAAVGSRMRYDRHSERAAATGLLCNAIIVFPIYALACTRLLTARALTITSGVFSVAVFAAAAYGRPLGPFARHVFREIGQEALMVVVALREAWRARSLVLVGLLFSVGLIGWTAITAYYAPSWRQWDALWYHEPLIGFTLQNHGFLFDGISLPPASGVQKVNGYPALCEMTQLWFVIFTDRRLIEMANSVLAPLFMLLVYLLAKRHGSDRVAATGWAAAMLIMPGTSILLASVYVDIHTALLVLGAVYFGTRMPLRLRDVLLTAMCLAMAIGAKVLALAPVGVISLIVLARMFWNHLRSRPRQTLGTLLAGMVMMAIPTAWTYLRNWRNFHNPFWPDLVYDNPRFGIHWTGHADGVEDGQPVGTLLENLTNIPYSHPLGHATQLNEYGFMSGWFFFPLAAACLVPLVFLVVRAPLGRIWGVRRWRMSTNTVAVVYVAIVLLGSLYIDPAPFWSARYYTAHTAMATALVGWACGRRGFERLHEGIVATVTVGMIIAFFWTTPRWWYGPSELLTLARTPYPAREFTPAAAISSRLHLTSGSGIPLETGLARERLGPGAVLATGDNDGAIVGLFWNNDYSNKVVYVPSGPDFLARVEATGATWLFCAYADSIYPTLHAKDSGWTEVGATNVEHWGAFFRRTRW